MTYMIISACLGYGTLEVTILGEVFMVLLWLPFYSKLFPSGHYLI